MKTVNVTNNASEELLIDVPSEYALIQANEEIRSKINDLSADINDILSNISTLSYDIELLDSSITSEISDFPNLSEPVSDLDSFANIVINEVSHSITHIFGILPEFERVVHEVNLGNIGDRMNVDLFNFDFDLSDVGSWGAELLKNIGNKLNIFSATGFLINYAMNLNSGTELLRQASDDVSEVTSNEVSEALWSFIVGKVSSSQLVGSAQPLWINAPVGGIVASIGVGLIDLVTNDGVWEDLDTQRLLADMTSVFGATVVKTAVASVAAAQLGSALGGAAGPVGALIGGIAGWGVGALIDWASAELIGDVAVDKFILYTNPDGSLDTIAWSQNIEDYTRYLGNFVQVYEVPRNGVGDNGSYSVLADSLLREVNREYRIGRDICSDRYFSNHMYSDNWYDTMISLGVEEEFLHKEVFENFLNDIMSHEFHSEDEINYYFLENYGYSYDVHDSDNDGFKIHQTIELIMDYTSFNLWDYYKHNITS